jgi:hypothetical protein
MYIEQGKLFDIADWDILIVLDAVRYDKAIELAHIFEVPINIIQAKSPATCTFSWVLEIFEKRYFKDTIFISGHRWISNEGPRKEKLLVFREKLKYGKRLLKFDPRDHFKKIIDVWKYGYEDEYKTTPPQTMVKEIIRISKENPDTKIMSKFSQIHTPYMYYLQKEGYKKEKESEIESRRLQYDNLYNFIGFFLNDELLTKIRVKFGIPPKYGMMKYWLQYGREGIIKGYEEDLKVTLLCIKKIVDEFPEKTIAITADHGERLGEKGRYSHAGRHDKIVTKVPWLIINGGKDNEK